MARWGTPTWGDGTIWGEPAPVDRPVTWVLEIDYDGDGQFSGRNDGGRMYQATVTRGRQFVLRNDNTGFELPSVGTADIGLRNDDGRFDANLPLPLRPGLYARLSIYDEDTSTLHPQMSGRISTVKHIYEGGAKTVQLTIEDGMRLLQSEVTTAIQEDIRVDDAINMLLDAVGWPSEFGRDIAIDGQLIPFWWADGVTARSALQDLLDATMGLFYIAADGRATYRAFSTPSSISFALTGADILDSLSTPQPWDVIRNSIRVNAYPYRRQSLQVVWDAGEVLAVNAGGSIEIWTDYRFGEMDTAVVDAIVPQPTVDYVANSEEDGSGVDLTAQFQVQVLGQFARSAKLRIRNNSGFNGFLLRLEQRADPIAYVNSSFALSEDQASIDLFGRLTLIVSTPFIQQTGVSTGVASTLSSQFHDARNFPRVTIAANPDAQYGADIFDVITLDVSSLGATQSYRIGQMTTEWTDETGYKFRSTYQLEPFVSTDGYWHFPTHIGVSSIFGPP